MMNTATQKTLKRATGKWFAWEDIRLRITFAQMLRECSIRELVCMSELTFSPVYVGLVNAEWRYRKAARRDRLRKARALQKARLDALLEESFVDPTLWDNLQEQEVPNGHFNIKMVKKPIVARSPKQKRQSRQPYPSKIRGYVVRDADLARWLRNIIRTMQLERLPCANKVCHKELEARLAGKQLLKELLAQVSLPNKAHPESDRPGVDGDDMTTQEPVSNVILTTQRDPSVAVTAPPAPRWSQWTTNDIVDSYATITDRWYQINQVTWTKDQQFDTELYRLVLPRELLRYIERNNEAVCDVPNTIPFKVHAYWRGDIEVKIQINSNKFQVGQLQATWYYDDEKNLTIGSKRSVYGFSQMEHTLIMASSSNEATIKVPYKNVYPFLPTANSPDWHNNPLNMGSLSLRVLSPLRMSANGPSSCSVVTFIRLINSEFTGTRTGKLYVQPTATPEMDILGPVAETLLTNVLGGHNMDNPPYVQAPRYLVPTATHSLAVGTNISEPLHPLRLDARGQTQHMRGCEPDEAMLVSSIASHYALIKQVRWHKDMIFGTKLFTIDADPFAITRATQGAIDTYWIPPVGVISGNFMYWRGSLEYRFDIIASQFHTGRLIVGYVPAVDASSDELIDVNSLKSSPYVVYDLQEGNSFTFTVPYVSYRPWWPRKYAGNYEVSTTNAPSRLFVMVQVPLTPMESVAAEVDINIYLRGGSSFEVSVPVQPAFGLNWNTDFILRNDEQYRVLQGYAPYYAGTWHSFDNGESLVFRYGTLSEQVAAWPAVVAHRNSATYFRIEDVSLAPKGAQVWPYMIVWPSGHGYSIGIPVRTEDLAIRFASFLYGGGSLGASGAKQFFTSSSLQGEGAYCIGNPVWRRIDVPLAQGFEIVANPEGEDMRDTIVLDTTKTLAHTNFGAAFFGENFNDLKTLCRRYQLYGQIDIGMPKDKAVDNCLLTFPCLPQGLKLGLGQAGNVNETFNRCRDGIIPLISSGYRYYRGGLRFKVVLPTSTALNIWVQHRPDRRLRQWDDARITLCDGVTTGQGTFNHGYAAYLQVTQVNNVVEFEVPFYNATCYNLLQPFIKRAECDTYALSLGEIAMGISAPSAIIGQLVGKPVLVYYSIADDMQFSTWVGYQPMIILDRLPAVVKAIPEGPVDYVIQKFSSHFRDDVDGIIKEQSEKVAQQAQSVVDTITEKISDKPGIGLTDPGVRSTLFGIVSHLISAVMAENVKQLAWSIVSVFIHMGVFSMEIMDRARQVVMRILSKVYTGKQPQNEPLTGGTANPEGPSEETSDCAAWVSILYTGVASLFGITKNLRAPKHARNWASWFEKDVGMITRSANSVFTFVRNTFDVLRRIFDYLICTNDGRAALLKQIETCPQMITAWVKECLTLDVPEYRLRRADDQAYVERVFSAQAFGQILISSVLEDAHSKHMAVLTRIYDRITALKTDLMQAGNNPFIRKECYTMCITGEPGVGKSAMVDSICSHLLKATNTRVSGGLKAVVNPLSSYWDQVEHQPVLAVDDMFAVETEPMLSNQLAMLFSVHSPIVLSPPKADLEGKKMRYNPEIFVYNTNKPFPVFDRIVPEAIYRRRHVLINVASTLSVDPKAPKVDGCAHCAGGKLDDTDPAMLKDMHHVRLRLADCVTDPNTKYSQWYSFQEFLDIITPMYVANRKRAATMFRERCDMATTLRGGDALPGKCVLESHDEIHRDMLVELETYKQRTLLSDIANLCDSTKAKFGAYYKRMLPDLSGGVFTPEKRREYIARYNASFGTVTIDEAMPESEYVVDEIADDAVTSEYAATEDILHDARAQVVPTQYEMVERLVAAGIITSQLGQRIAALLDTHGDTSDTFDVIMEPMLAILEYALQNRSDLFTTASTLPMFFKQCQQAAQACKQTRLAVACEHCYWNVKRIYVSGDKLMYMGTIPSKGPEVTRVNVDDECCGTCIMQNPIGRHMFYAYWLHSNPTWQLKYQRNISLMPAYFKGSCPIDRLGKLEFLVAWLKSKYLEYLNPTVKRVWNFLKSNLPQIILGLFITMTTLSVGVSTVAMCKGTYDMMGTSFVQPGKWAMTSAPEGLKYGEAVTPKATRLIAQPATAKPQSSSQQSEMLEGRIRDNSIIILAVRPGRSELRFRGVLVRGRQCLIVRHYYDYWKKMPTDTKFYATYEYDNAKRISSIRGVEFKPSEQQIIEYEGKTNDGEAYTSNLMLITLPVQFPEGKNLSKFFAQQRDHWKAYGTGVLVNGKRSQLVDFRSSRTAQYTIADSECNPVVLTGCYTYPYHGSGMCGTLIMSDNLERPIIGVHVAGVDGPNGHGIAEPLFYETFGDLPILPTQPYDDVAEIQLASVDLKSINLETALLPYGTVPDKLAAPQSDMTHIKPSKIQGVFEVRTEPNPLSAKDKRIAPNDPLQLGCEHYGKPTIDFPKSDLIKATKHLSEKLIDQVKPINGCKIRSLQEAVCGIPGVEGYDSISWETSCGFPLSSIKPKGEKGKRWCFTIENTSKGYVLHDMHPELRRLIATQMEMRKKGIKPQTVFTDCLKDTCLPLEKCKIPGKTRVFSISPLQYTIPFRQYFIDFMASYRAARLKAEHGIGINVNGPEWGQLARYLTSKGDKILTGDYSNYGPGLNLEAAQAAFSCIIDWIMYYTEEEDKAELRRVLWTMAQEILCSWHLARNMVYRIMAGIPSGSPITDILNTITNGLYLRCAWLNLTKQPLTKFSQHTALALYGDDVAISVSDEFCDVFNTETLYEFFFKHNIKFTDTDKSGAIVKWRHISDSSFLKHGFLPHPLRAQQYLANLDKISVEGAANWIRDGISVREATMLNAQQSLELAYGWGPAYYNQVREKLRCALRDQNMSIDMPTWDDVDERCFGTAM